MTETANDLIPTILYSTGKAPLLEAATRHMIKERLPATSNDGKTSRQLDLKQIRIVVQ